MVGTYTTDTVFDPNDGMVYVSQYGVNDIKVADPVTNKVVRTIPLPSYGRSMALNVNEDALYVLLEYGTFVKVNCYDGTVSKQIVVTENYLSDVAYNPRTNRVYICSYSGKIYVYEGTTLALQGAIPVGSTYNPVPENLAINPKTNKIYCILYSESGVAVIDGATMKVTKFIKIGEHSGLRGITCLPALNRVYVSNENSEVDVIDGDLDTVIKQIPVRAVYGYETYPLDLVGDAAQKRLFVGVNSNDLLVIDTETNKQIGAIGAADARQVSTGLAIDQKTHTIYKGASTYDGPKVLIFSYAPSTEGHLVQGQFYRWVTDPNNSLKVVKQGIPNVGLWIPESNSPYSERSTYADSTGHYSIRLPNSNYTLAPFFGDGNRTGFFTPFQAGVTVDGKDVVQDFVAYTVSGQVTDETGKGMAGVKVIGTPDFYYNSLETVTDAYGYYSFKFLGQGNVMIAPTPPTGRYFVKTSLSRNLPTFGTAGLSPNARANFQLAPPSRGASAGKF